MAETLATLRAATLDWLDNPSGDLFAPSGDYSRCDRLINEAYRSLVREVSRSSKAWNIYESTVTLTVVTTAREYEVNGTDAQGNYNVRKVIDVVRTDLPNELQYELIPWSQRNEPPNISYNKVPTLRTGRSHKVYVYRRDTGIWVMGFASEEPEDQTCVVRYEPFLKPLVNAADEPTQMPFDWQSLIAVAAAILGLKQTRAGEGGKQWQELQSHHDRELAKFREDVGSLASRVKSARF